MHMTQQHAMGAAPRSAPDAGSKWLGAGRHVASGAVCGGGKGGGDARHSVSRGPVRHMGALLRIASSSCFACTYMGTFTMHRCAAGMRRGMAQRLPVSTRHGIDESGDGGGRGAVIAAGA